MSTKQNTNNIPDAVWKIYYRLLKLNPQWSKKRALTVARYAYLARQKEIEA